VTGVRLIESGHNEWQAFDDNNLGYLNYVGLVRQFGDTFRAYGTRLSLDYVPVSRESPDFGSKDEAKAWLLDGVGVEA
jgi:hypothetical protein